MVPDVFEVICIVNPIKLRPDLITIEDNGLGGVIKKSDSYGIDGVKERLNLIEISEQLA